MTRNLIFRYNGVKFFLTVFVLLRFSKYSLLTDGQTKSGDFLLDFDTLGTQPLRKYRWKETTLISGK